MARQQRFEFRERCRHASETLESPMYRHRNARAIRREVARMEIHHDGQIALVELRKSALNQPKRKYAHVPATREAKSATRNAHDAKREFRHHAA
jgi:hypothetical protein